MDSHQSSDFATGTNTPQTTQSAANGVFDISPLPSPLPTNRTKKYLFLGLSIVVLLLITGGIVVLMSGKRYADTSNTQPDPTPKTQQTHVLTKAEKSADDTERKADITALQTQLEAYYVARLGYPTVAEINSVTFRAQYFKNFDPAILKDPRGTSNNLSKNLEDSTYSYYPLGFDARECDTGDTVLAPDGITYIGVDHCVKYFLTARLSDGTSFSLFSLHR